MKIRTAITAAGALVVLGPPRRASFGVLAAVS